MELVQSPLTIGKKWHSVHTHTWYIIKKCPSPLVHPFLPFSPHLASFLFSDFMSQLWRKIVKIWEWPGRRLPPHSHTHTHTHTRTHTLDTPSSPFLLSSSSPPPPFLPLPHTYLLYTKQSTFHLMHNNISISMNTIFGKLRQVKIWVTEVWMIQLSIACSTQFIWISLAASNTWWEGLGLRLTCTYSNVPSFSLSSVSPKLGRQQVWACDSDSSMHSAAKCTTCSYKHTLSPTSTRIHRYVTTSPYW